MSIRRTAAERVTLVEDVDKILSATAFVISLANQQGVQPTQFDILKSLFLADRSHLNEWGRPITFDNYVAMRHGPVPSAVYDLLKENAWRKKKLGVDVLPWQRHAGPNGKFFYTDAAIENVEDVLSLSEINALRFGIETVLKLDFWQVRRLTHEDPAYVEAWDDESEELRFPMSLGLMFEEPDYESARVLSEYSPYR